MFRSRIFSYLRGVELVSVGEINRRISSISSKDSLRLIKPQEFPYFDKLTNHRH